MARVTSVADSGETRSPYTVVNALITDYFSQTDTDDQTVASNVTGASGKYVDFPTVKADTVSEHTAAAGVTTDGVKHKDGDVELATGVVERTITGETLGAAVTTFAVTGEVMEITGDGGANTIATITGGSTGQELTLIFVDTNVTITDTDAHTANTVDLSAAFTSADDTVLKLIFDGTSWYEISRSVN